MPYRIPAQAIRNEIIVQKSRFITSIEYTPEKILVHDFIKQIRRSMPDASHHVYAFRIGHGNSVVEGMSDDGEPSGTSAPPTLAVLRGSEIGDITLVTTRYFGGKKLGKGGLVRAYTDAARSALDKLSTKIKTEYRQLTLSFDYSLYDRVKYVIKDYGIKLEEETFTTEVAINLTIVKDQENEFICHLIELSAGQIRIKDETS